MKLFGIILVAIGGIGILLGLMMFVDIGISALIGAITALVSGISFLKLNKILVNLQKPLS